VAKSKKTVFLEIASIFFLTDRGIAVKFSLPLLPGTVSKLQRVICFSFGIPKKDVVSVEWLLFAQSTGS
jgi:hypothetical protein